MNSKQELIKFLLENESINLELIIENNQMFEEALRGMCSQLSLEDFNYFNNYFDFRLLPQDAKNNKGKRVHALSLILDFDIAKYPFHGKELQKIIPHIPKLNHLFNNKKTRDSSMRVFIMLNFLLPLYYFGGPLFFLHISSIVYIR